MIDNPSTGGLRPIPAANATVACGCGCACNCTCGGCACGGVEPQENVLNGLHNDMYNGGNIDSVYNRNIYSIKFQW